MNDDDPAMPPQVRRQVATGTMDGQLLINALGLNGTGYISLELHVNAEEIITLKTERYLTRGEVADLAAAIAANPPQLEEEK